MSNIEEDIKRCEQLTRPENANWIGISNQLAIAGVLAERKQDKARIKELEEENKKLKAKIDVTNWQEKTAYESLKERYIPVQKVKDEIEALRKMLKATMEGKLQEYTPGEIIIKRNTLEELLEDK